MNIHTGYFENPSQHHTGWFRVFRGRGIIEIWAGKHYLMASWW